MNEATVSVNGVVSGGDDARVSVFDRGFLYGDSVFEVYRTYNGAPFMEREHLERLRRSADLLMIPMPRSIDELADEARETIAASGLRDAYVRVIVTRGSGPLTYDPTTAGSPSRVIIVAPVHPPDESLYETGSAALIVTASRPTDDVRASGAKASNYLANLLVVHEAKQRGAHEALLLGSDGQILEGASSNLFIVRDGRLVTPPEQPGILMGITRATVLQLAAMQDIGVEEAEVYPTDLMAADEAFITSSIREVMPIVRVDGQPVGNGSPGPVTARMRQAYKDAIRAAASV